MKKININMLSIADVVKGQGVETAYNELMELLTKYGSNDFNIVKNKGLNYDILHMHTVNPISYIKQRLTKGVTLTYVHFLPDMLEGSIKLPKILLNIYAWWVKKCYMKSDYLVVVNKDYIDTLSNMGYDKKRIFYIPNVVGDTFKVLKSKKKLKDKYNLNSFVVTSVGQLNKNKGVLDFIDLAKKNPSITFVWVGDFTFGKTMDGYKKIKNAILKKPSNMIFTGLKERYEINEILNASDVFLLPSYYESFALVALEAAKTELPIILRDIPSYKSIYKNNVLYGDNNTFSDLIIKLKSDKDFYRKMSNNSKKITNMYSDKKIYEEWVKLYKKIVK